MKNKALAVMVYEPEWQYYVKYKKFLNEEGWLIPGIFIYLDINDEEVARRHEMETGRYKTILLNNQFNSFIRDFYANEVLRIFPSMSMFQINAHNSIEDVFLEVVRVIFT